MGIGPNQSQDLLSTSRPPSPQVPLGKLVPLQVAQDPVTLFSGDGSHTAPPPPWGGPSVGGGGGMGQALVPLTWGCCCGWIRSSTGSRKLQGTSPFCKEGSR